MYETAILKLRNLPIFSLADVSQIVSGKEYAKKLLRRMINSREIKKIKRDAYTFYDDAFLISTFLVKPSYISSASALSYYKLITQIPKDIFCFTNKRNIKLKFNSGINFFHTNYFFGFENKEYGDFSIPIATPEKAIIDSINIIPISIFEESIEKINLNIILNYLQKINKSSILKRVGYLLESKGFDVYKKLNKKINSRYLYLDPLAKKTGKRDKKWKLIVNVK